eukprot:362619-Chlamydomonas_euryale.AAC.2
MIPHMARKVDGFEGHRAEKDVHRRRRCLKRQHSIAFVRTPDLALLGPTPKGKAHRAPPAQPHARSSAHLPRSDPGASFLAAAIRASLDISSLSTRARAAPGAYPSRSLATACAGTARHVPTSCSRPFPRDWFPYILAPAHGLRRVRSYSRRHGRGEGRD